MWLLLLEDALSKNHHEILKKKRFIIYRATQRGSRGQGQVGVGKERPGVPFLLELRVGTKRLAGSFFIDEFIT